jgi:hypothetical protein
MYSTSEDIYRSFLKEIKKDNIVSVPPVIFNAYIRDAENLWYREKSIEIERDQKRIDDLKEWIVETSPSYNYNGADLQPIRPTVLNLQSNSSSNLFPLPKSSDNSFSVQIINQYTNYNGNVVTNEITYPNYRRRLNIKFKYAYYNDPCYPDGTESPWIPGKVLRANEENEIRKNPFRKPSYSNIYYKLIGNNVKLWLGDNTQNLGTQMLLEYIKYPRPINFDPAGVNNVMSELQSDQIHEIVKIAARVYVAEASDPRYQNKMNELMVNHQGK